MTASDQRYTIGESPASTQCPCDASASAPTPMRHGST